MGALVGKEAKLRPLRKSSSRSKVMGNMSVDLLGVHSAVAVRL
jgi:hypothetical protein